MRLVAELFQDARYAMRSMRRAPGFTAVAVLTLALGIGANTAIFSVLYGVWLSPVKYAQARRLVDVSMQQLSGHRFSGGTSSPNLADWRAQTRTIEAFGAHRYAHQVNVTGNEGAEEVIGHRVSANLFGLLGVSPAVGYPMEAGADRSSGPRQALIGYTWWKRRFGGDVGVVGRQIQVNDETFTIAGVMPRGFEFPPMGSAAYRPVIWTSLNLPVEQERARDRHSLSVVARLKPGASIQQAQAEMDTIVAGLAKAYPQEDGGWGVKVTSLTDARQLEDVRPALLLVMAAASLVLLIACANIANLLVARAAGREREMAIRRALGVTWHRLARQLLTESGMLALCGGAAGLLLAYGTLPLLKSALPANMPRADEIGLNGVVLGFGAAVSLLTGLLFGLVPAVRPGGSFGLGSGGRTVTARNHTARLLVTVEVALALVLLAGAGLLVESLRRVLNVDLGFRKEHALTIRMDLSKRSYPDGTRVRAFREELLRRVYALPGVQYAGTVSSLPMGLIMQGTEFAVEGRPETEREKPFANYSNTSTDYLRAMGIPLVGWPVLRKERRCGGATGDDRQRVAGARVVAGNRGAGQTHTVRRDVVHDRGDRQRRAATDDERSAGFVEAGSRGPDLRAEPPIAAEQTGRGHGEVQCVGHPYAGRSGRDVGDGPAGGGGDRQEPAGGGGGDHGEGGGEHAGVAAAQHAVTGAICRASRDAGRGGGVRGGVIRGGAKDQGNRNSHGAGRHAGVGVGDGGVGNAVSGRHRSGHWSGGNGGDVAASVQVSVWREAGRASGRGRSGDFAGGGSGRLRAVSSTASAARGSDGGTAGGLTRERLLGGRHAGKSSRRDEAFSSRRSNI